MKSEGGGVSEGQGRMSYDGEPQHEPTLKPEDAAALEALFAGGLNPSAVDPAGRARAERVLGLLSRLEAGPAARAEDRRDLVDLTVARAVRAGRRMGPGSLAAMSLTARDADAVDAMEIAGQDRGRVPAVLSERASRVEAIGALVRGGPSAAGGKSLVDAVMARVEREEEARAERLRLSGSRGYGLAPLLARWRDVVSAAAVLLIATSVLWTIGGAMSHYQSRASCLSGLRSVATAMGQYGKDFRDELPMATASLGGAKWWDVKRDAPVSNASNLYTLPRKGYATPAELACAGNPGACRSGSCEPGAMDWSCLEEISYSYQIMFGERKPRWNDSSRHVVLTDRSPVVRRAVRGEAIAPEENSANHDGRGQNVLFSDGSAVWARTPVTESGDNMWLPRPRVFEVRVTRTPGGAEAEGTSVIRIEGREVPQDPDDAFVGP